MILEKIDEQRLLIALTSEDMNTLDLDFKSLTWRNEYSRQIIKQLLLKAESEIGFFVDDSQMMIEAIPQDNGCFVLITLMTKRNLGRKIYKIKENEKTYLFEFKSLDDILNVIDLLYSKKLFDFKNTILECKDKYYIVVCFKGAIPFNIQSGLTEYGHLLSDNFVYAARMLELGKILVKNDAIKIMGRSFSKKS